MPEPEQKITRNRVRHHNAFIKGIREGIELSFDELSKLVPSDAKDNLMIMKYRLLDKPEYQLSQWSKEMRGITNE